MADRFFSIRNWKTFQHYKARNPPWIRLYRTLLRNRDYQNLSDTSRSHLVGLFILASTTDNCIPDDQKWLRHELCTKSAIDLKTLEASGFIEYTYDGASNKLAASAPLAECKRDTPSETDSSETDSSETDSSETDVPRKRGKTPPPVNLVISSELRSFAIQLGVLDIDQQTESMLDHFRAKGESRSDWLATWRNWIRNSKNFNGGRNGTHKSKTDINRENAERLRAKLDSQDSGLGFSDPV